MRNVTELSKGLVKGAIGLNGLRKRCIVWGALLATLSSVILFATSTNLEAQGIPLDPVTWTPIGPAPTVNGNTDYIENASGRMTALAAHPNLPNVIYIAAAGGGVWKTTNAQEPNPADIKWTPLTNDQKTLVTGAIALAPSNPEVIYAGTGEANMGPSKAKNFRDNIYYGRGILKSTDGGTTWTLLGTAEFDRRTISKIVVHPTDPDTVYVAVGALATNGLPDDTGIWKSIDGGATWHNTTEGQISTVTAHSDLVMDPSNPQILYAAVGEPGVDPARPRGDNGVWKTTDGGDTWARAGNFPTGQTSTQVGRITLAISLSAPQTVFAAIARPGPPNSMTNSLFRIMKTSNGGTTWIIVTDPGMICPENGLHNYLAGAGDYHNTLAVDPTNRNIVYAGGLCLIRGIRNPADPEGTFTWNAIATGETSGPHRDHHALGFEATGKLLNGNDGGIWRLDDPDLLTWANLNGNLQITQFVGMALHPTDADIAYGGTQDTGTMKFLGNLQWQRFLRGDGGASAVSALSASAANRVYQITRIVVDSPSIFRRSDDGGQTWSIKVRCLEFPGCLVGNDPKNFYPPMVLDPANSDPVGDLDRLLLGTDRVYETTDNAETWSLIGPPPIFMSNIDSLAAASSDVNTIYVSAGEHLFVTFDRGATWQQRDITGLTDPHFRGLLVDPTNNLIAYAVRDRFDDQFNRGHVFRTTDGGQSWTDISGDLPELPTNTMVLHPRASTHILYVGTDDGVYASTDLGAHWARFGMGLPNAQVADLKLNLTLGILAAGTHGRGVWEILVPAP